MVSPGLSAFFFSASSGNLAQSVSLRTPLRWLLVALALIAAAPAAAHPAPFSYVDLDYGADRIKGTVTVHAIDIARELDIDEPADLLEEGRLQQRESAIMSLLSGRIHLAGETTLQPHWSVLRPAPERDAVVLAFTVAGEPPPALQVDAHLFPEDPMHQTFVNIYEGGDLAQQWVFGAETAPQIHYAGTAAGAMQVVSTFLPSGIEHILIGPDHILFLVGLMLLGGSLRRLAIIVTGFTVGHSITLALAATNMLTPPSWLIEPVIALSIVMIGADNLLREKEGGRDLRGWLALVFGLVHGFGFAFVLREFGLPDASLAWALVSFNIGVEIGQLVIVLPLAALIALLHKRSPAWARRVAMAGSLAVMAAGAYWFVDRVFFTGVA
jgi:hydrogenase/urease accessory protein HupE